MPRIVGEQDRKERQREREREREREGERRLTPSRTEGIALPSGIPDAYFENDWTRFRVSRSVPSASPPLPSPHPSAASFPLVALSIAPLVIALTADTRACPLRDSTNGDTSHVFSFDREHSPTPRRHADRGVRGSAIVMQITRAMVDPDMPPRVYPLLYSLIRHL